MKILFWGLILFFLAFMIHVIIWRFHLPKRQHKAITQIFFATLILSLLSLWIFLPSSSVLLVPEKFIEYIHISFFFASLTFVYIFTYTALEADSPSLNMVLAVAEAGPDGLDRIIFDQIITDNNFIKSRLDYLVRDKIVTVEGGRFRLTSKVIFLVSIFLFYRKLLNVTQRDLG